MDINENAAIDGNVLKSIKVLLKVGLMKLTVTHKQAHTDFRSFVVGLLFTAKMVPGRRNDSCSSPSVPRWPLEKMQGS
jgi:hypothetical protein